LTFLVWAVIAKEARIIAMQIAMGLVLLVAALLDPSHRVSAVRDRVESMLAFDTSIVWRAYELEQEKRLIREHPLVGHGWGLSSKVKISYLGDMPSYGHDVYTGLGDRQDAPRFHPRPRGDVLVRRGDRDPNGDRQHCSEYRRDELGLSDVRDFDRAGTAGRDASSRSRQQKF
jgi:hypothetical protein